MVLRGDEAKELYELARKKNRVLLEASKTAFSPAWSHLQVLVKSGVIGEVIDVKASLSKLVSGDVRELDANQAGGSMTELSSFPLMSIVKLLGMDYAELNFHSKIVNGVDVFTRGVINYDNATSSITLGLGVKTEGNLVISGTKGYVLVPSPWWLTSYFEVRYEDQNLNQKYFYAWQGEGLRYEIQEFVSMIVQGRISSYKLSWIESVTIAGIIEEYIKGDRTKILK